MSDIRELADEYVLGLLDPGEERLVANRIEREADLRAAVGVARDRFLELDLAGAPAAASADLWQRIASGLDSGLGADPSDDGEPKSRPSSPSVGRRAAAAPANDNAARRWRLGALVATAASLILAVGLGWSLVAAPQPIVIAVLLDEAGEAQALVEDFGDASARITPLVDFDVPEGRTMQVWTLPSRERGPVSLGLLGRSAGEVLGAAGLPAPKADQLYEITLEQAGGSPTGRPTGPILVKGFAKVPR